MEAKMLVSMPNPDTVVVAGMYVGVLLLVFGWCVSFSSPLLAIYAGILAIAFHIRVIRHEEPWLESEFGDDWESYRAKVPRWLPSRRRVAARWNLISRP